MDLGVDMAEILRELTESLGITPYQYEPTEASINDDSEDSESDVEEWPGEFHGETWSHNVVLLRQMYFNV